MGAEHPTAWGSRACAYVNAICSAGPGAPGIGTGERSNRAAGRSRCDLAGVDRHPHPDGHAVRPPFYRQGALRLDGRGHGAARRTEEKHAAVAASGVSGASMGTGGRAEDRALRSRTGRKASPSDPSRCVEPSMSVKTSVTIRLPGTVLGGTPLPRAGKGTVRFRGVTENAPPLPRSFSEAPRRGGSIPASRGCGTAPMLHRGAAARGRRHPVRRVGRT